MARPLQHRRPRRVHLAILVVAAVAAVASAAVVGLAVARTLTLGLAEGATVTSQAGASVTESIVVNAKGRAVYTLSGDTTGHPKCTKAGGCFSFWPPVTVRSVKGLGKAAGVKGKLGTFERDGIIQVTLGGHPLYTFSQDRQRAHASGEGVNAFGGIWHVVNNAGGHRRATGSPSTTSSTATSPYPGY